MTRPSGESARRPEPSSSFWGWLREALAEEIRRNPSAERRIESETLLAMASKAAEIDDRIADRANELQSFGYGAFDALHLAAAEAARVDVLLSTDDQFVRRASHGAGHPRVTVRNPLSWVREQRLRSNPKR
jgi:predicted nucleic acid-binding protein